MVRGKKLALLVGCNYPDTEDELRYCHNDALAMREVIISKFGFDPKCIKLLIDKPGNAVMPTGANIKRGLNEMVVQAKPGDILFFFYSGHGNLIDAPRNNSSSSVKKEEIIVPCDYNFITSVDFRELVSRVPKGASFTLLTDSCHSGGLIDKEKEQIGPSTTTHNRRNPKMITSERLLQHLSSQTNINTTNIGTHLLELFGADASLMFRRTPIQHNKSLKKDQGILLSGCQSNELCDDGIGENFNGAFTHAVRIAIEEDDSGRPLTNREVVLLSRKFLKVLQVPTTQHPCLYCSDENADAYFLFPPHPHKST